MARVVFRAAGAAFRQPIRVASEQGLPQLGFGKARDAGSAAEIVGQALQLLRNATDMKRLIGTRKKAKSSIERLRGES